MVENMMWFSVVAMLLVATVPMVKAKVAHDRLRLIARTRLGG